jgi:hypothetical protein
MAAKLHDADVRSSILARVRALKPDARGRWGKMTVDQMLWHCNEAMAHSIGEADLGDKRPPIPRALVKFLVLNLPWTKGAPTSPALVAKSTHDFEAERTRCVQLVDRLANRTIAGVWIDHPTFGPMVGEEVSRFHAKHLDHHLRQFGV